MIRKTDTKDTLSIVTVSLECSSSWLVSNSHRIELLEKIIKEFIKYDVVVLPGGYFSFRKVKHPKLHLLEKKIINMLQKYQTTTTICFGVDSRNGSDQLAFALNRGGMIASGRKFYPTDEEKRVGKIKLANSYIDEEFGCNRTFEVKDRKFYLAVCYDSFGIRLNRENAIGADIVLNFVHQFNPKGEGISGESYFARYGFMGLSMYWHCFVFGSSVFFNRKVPEKWPTGVCVNSVIDLQKVKYEDNSLQPIKKDKIITDIEIANCYRFEII